MIRLEHFVQNDSSLSRHAKSRGTPCGALLYDGLKADYPPPRNPEERNKEMCNDVIH